MKSNSIKEIKSGRAVSKNVLGYIVAIVIIVLSLIILNTLSSSARNTVSVLAFKKDMISKSVISADDIKTITVTKSDYNSEMLLSEEKDSIIGTYTNYYVRRETPIYKDQVTRDNPLRNEYLYLMGTDKELITIPYEFLEAGGIIPVPGDNIRIRASYRERDITGEETIIMKTLFDNVQLKDLINRKGVSIFEEYKALDKLSEVEKQEKLRTEEFISSVTPVSMLIVAGREETDEYVAIQSGNQLNYLITILKRNKVDGDIDLTKIITGNN